jgi:hypothetical protein
MNLGKVLDAIDVLRFYGNRSKLFHFKTKMTDRNRYAEGITMLHSGSSSGFGLLDTWLSQ